MHGLGVVVAVLSSEVVRPTPFRAVRDPAVEGGAKGRAVASLYLVSLKIPTFKNESSTPRVDLTSRRSNV